MSRFVKVMVALLAIAAMATPAIAADDYKFSVYGSARMATFWNDTSEPADDADLEWALQGNSRFGMKASKGAVGGQFEVGTGVNTRLLFGTYKFDGGQLLIGQTYTPYTAFANQAYGADNGFIGYGALYDGRQPQIKVSFDNGFYVAGITNAGTAAGTDVTLPKLAVGYKGAADSFSYGANIAYQTYEDAAEDDIMSYLASFNGKLDMNPATLSFNLAYGQNATEFGISGTEVAVTATEDTTFMAGYAQVAFKANDNNTITAGVGYASEDNDDYAQKAERLSYFIQDSITLAPGFYVVPEISFFDDEDETGAKEKSFHVGAKWQVNF